MGESSSKVDIDVLDVASPMVIDWNNDDRKDLVVGAMDGRIYLYINQGSDTEPDFISGTFVQEDGSDLTVHALGSSPDVLDLDNDGKKDPL